MRLLKIFENVNYFIGYLFLIKTFNYKVLLLKYILEQLF